MAQNLNVPRSQGDYITQVSEEIQGRVTKKLSQEFSWTELILGALARLDDFLMNPLIQGFSGTAQETSRNAFGTNQKMNGDDSQSDPRPEAGIFHNQATRNSGPEDGHDTLIFSNLRIDCEHGWVRHIERATSFRQWFNILAISLSCLVPLWSYCLHISHW